MYVMTDKKKDKIQRSNSIFLEIASDLKYLELVQIVVNWLTSQLNFTEEEAFQVALSVGEAVCNAIIHGNHEDDEKHVKISITILPDALKATIRDEGKGFDVENVPSPVEKCNILKTCGRGIFYMKSYMDEVHFKRIPKGKGMEVTLLKYVKSKANNKFNSCQEAR
jgi:serine/threonine-protein kinase RsbW